MKEKIKVLFTHPKKLKQKTKRIKLGDLIEKESPDMYEFIYAYGEEDSINQVDKFRPEIIFINQVDKQIEESLGLLKKIKHLHPPVIVFIVLANIVEDEQETIDEYMAAGAYKCLFSTMVLETLVHDMYVALNLE